jgi:hypothetical protein
MPIPTRVNIEVPNFPNVLANLKLDSLDPKISPPGLAKRFGADFTFGGGIHGLGLYTFFDPNNTNFDIRVLSKGTYPVRKGGIPYYPVGGGVSSIDGPSVVEVTIAIDEIGDLDKQGEHGGYTNWFCPFSVYGGDPRDNALAVAIAVMCLEKSKNEDIIAVLAAIRLDGSNYGGIREKNAPPVVLGELYRFRIYTAADGQIYLFQAPVDKAGDIGPYVLIEYATLDKSQVKPTFRGGFLGAYGTDKVSKARTFYRDLVVRVP